jgi:hypothetical protein
MTVVYDVRNAIDMSTMDRRLSVLCLVVAPILMVGWWRFAIGRYLRLRHPWTLTACFTSMALLALLLAGYFPVVVNEIYVEW